MRRNRAAKIVATLGPSSSSPERIRALFEAGADVFRLNFSHGTHEDHRARFEVIRQIEAEYRPPDRRDGRPAGAEACGSAGSTRAASTLTPGNRFRLDMRRRRGDDRAAPLPHPEIFAALQAGTELLLDDGKLRLKVQHRGADFAETIVITGGRLSERKGVNVPNVVLPLSPLDRKGPAATSPSPSISASTGSRSPSCSGRRMSPRRAG